MMATQQLHELGQRLWLDTITRELLTSGTLKRYIDEFSVTGLTSNPTIFERAIAQSRDYDRAISDLTLAGYSGEALFYELAMQDLRQAADLFQPIYAASDGEDGWVSLEVSPQLANNSAATIAAAKDLYSRIKRPNVLIKIPGTEAGMAAIEETVFAGIPVNVTLLFSHQHYLAAADAYMKGIERRIEADLSPTVCSVASLFVSRWDVAVKDRVALTLHNRLGVAVAQRTYQAYCELLTSPRWQRLAQAGARPQRLLWASTGSKDPAASETLYVEALAAANTINTIPEKTLLAFAHDGQVTTPLPSDGAEALMTAFTNNGIDIDALAAVLQRQGIEAFLSSWDALLDRIAITSKAASKLGSSNE